MKYSWYTYKNSAFLSSWCLLIIIVGIVIVPVKSVSEEIFLYQKDGQAAGDSFGGSLASIGDIDGDGFDDYIVGASGADPGGLSAAGTVYVYSGDTGNLIYQKDGQAAGDSFGVSASSAGDVNNDGTPDFIVGADRADPGGLSSAGSVYVYSGTDGTLIYQKNGEAANDRFGKETSVTTAGDVNGDGFDDFMAGAPDTDLGGLLGAGSLYVFSGIDGSLIYKKNGTSAGDNFGLSATSLGDVNGDTISDFAVSACSADPGGLSGAGSVYVYSGIDGSLLYQVDGQAAGDSLGYVIASTGDVNGDGTPDFIAGASAADPGGLNDAGSAYVYSGVDGSVIYQKDGTAAGDCFGNFVSGLGDVNSDNRKEFVVAAPCASPGGLSGAGSVYVYDGATGLLRYQIDGTAADDFLGWPVASAGFINGDDNSDLLISAYDADPGGLNNAGTVYVYLTGIHFLFSDGEPGDDTWRSSGGTTYNINFEVLDGLTIDSVQYSVWSETGLGGSEIIPWTDIDTGVGATTYTTDWPIDFDSLIEGTNHVYSRIIDNIAQISDPLNATGYFYVKKDTTPPTIIDNQTGDDAQRDAPGTTYNVDFEDILSLLNNVQFAAWSGPAFTGNEAVSWTDITTGINAASYTTDWELDWYSLALGKNYISVRAYDNAGNVAVATDAFYVNKEVDIIFTDSGQALGNSDTQTIIMGDVDNDNDLDIIEGIIDSPSRLWLNDGSGNFTDSGQDLDTTERTLSISLGDIDNDSDLDLVFTKDGAESGERVWINDGNGNFTDSGMILLENNLTTSLDMSDVNNDGYLDFVTTKVQNSPSENATEVWINSKSGSFSLGDSFHADDSTYYQPFQVIVRDTDNDGDIDIFMSNFYSEDTILENDGDGYFTDSGQVLNNAWSMPENPYPDRPASLIDVNNDESLDIIDGRSTKIWLNDGNGIFVESGQTYGGDSYSQAVVDVDTDGDIDAIEGIDGGNQIWRNDGTGTFSDAGLRLGSSKTTSVAAGDVNNDGYVDFVAGNWGAPNKVWLGGEGSNPVNTSPGVSVPGTASVSGAEMTFNWSAGTDAETPTELLTYNLRVGTTPGGNDIMSGVIPAGFGNVMHPKSYSWMLKDLCYVGTIYWSVQTIDTGYAKSDWAEGTPFYYEGSMCFSFAQDTQVPSNWGMVTGDLNNDGFNDLVIENDTTNEISIRLNDGMGFFYLAGQDLVPSIYAYDYGLGDFDGDGDLDLVIGEGVNGNPSKIYFNDGTGTMVDSGQNMGTGRVEEVAVGDVDNDGDIDIAVGKYWHPTIPASQYPSKIWLNDGTGFFNDSGQALAIDNGWGGMSFSDIDLDGDADLVAGDGGNGRNIWLNDGTGIFTTAGQAIEVNDIWNGLADFDADGDHDIVGYSYGKEGKLWLNNGGVFSDSGQIIISGDSYEDGGLGDIDNDGYYDIVFAGDDNAIYFMNDGLGTFVNPKTITDGAFGRMVVVDVDNDMDLDLILGGSGNTDYGQVWTSNSSQISSYSLPSAPTVLSASSSGNDITFTWGDGSDGETAAILLTYNLRVGTSSGGHDVMSGVKEFGHGNVGHPYYGGTLQHTLKNLPDGTYYWGVQTIDATFAKSGWSQEQTFVLDSTAPEFPGVHTVLGCGSGCLELWWKVATETVSTPVTYNVYMATTSGGQNFSTPDASVTKQTARFTGLTDGTTYYFTVRAQDTAGNEDTNTTEKSRPSGGAPVSNCTTPFAPYPIISDGYGYYLKCQINGGTADDGFGSDISPIGDINNDGIIEFLVSATSADPGGLGDGGAVYVFDGFTGNLLYEKDGAGAGDYLGVSVSTAGDVDGDGINDFIIGAHFADPDEKMNAGSAYIYDGSTGDLLYQRDGAASWDQYAVSVSTAGDLNGDGQDDFIVGAHATNNGTAYFYSGKTGDLIFKKNGMVGNDYFGISVATSMDITGDSVSDFLIGAHGADPDGNSSAGSVFVYDGASRNLLYRLDGESTDDWFGRKVSAKMDVTGDGISDFLIGASGADPEGRSNAGVVYVYDGASGTLIYKKDGETTNDRFGRVISYAGDLTGDGKAEFAVGVSNAQPGGLEDAGTVYVFDGSTGTLLAKFDSTELYSYFGSSIASIGDINNDGKHDIVIGAHSSSSSGNAYSGSVYVFATDFASPTTTITSFTDGSSYNTQPAVAGTSADTGGAGVVGVEVEIYSVADDSYWDGVAWASGVAWLAAATSTNAWNYSTLPAWEQGKSYRISSRATDKANNVETPAQTGTFTIDTSGPSAVSYVYDGADADVDVSNSSDSLVANWAAAADAESGIAAYWYSAGTTAGASNTVNWTRGSNATGTTVSSLPLLDLTTYYFSVKAENGSGIIGLPTTSDGVLVVFNGPEIDILSPTAGSSRQGVVTVTGSVQDVNLTGWTLKYGPGSSPTEWKQIAAGTTAVNGSTLVAWDSSSLNGTYTLRLKATNSYGLQSVETVTFIVGNRKTISGTVSADTWTLMGTPVDPDAASPIEMFGVAEYKVFRWDPEAEDQTYLHCYRYPDSLSAGQSFWIKSYDADLPYSYEGTVTDSTQEYSIALKPGWNQIGSPYDRAFPVSLLRVKDGGTEKSYAAAVNEGLLGGALVEYDGSSWVQVSDTGNLEARKGYSIRAYKNLELLFDPGAGQEGGLARVVRPVWGFKLKISAEAGGLSDRDNYIGTIVGAQEEFDPRDLDEPMGVPDEDYLALYFPRESWSRNAGRYTNDIRPLMDTTGEISMWTFDVETTQSGETVTLTWDASSLPGDKYDFTLVDIDNGEKTDMVAVNTYSYVAEGDPVSLHHFRIEVTKLEQEVFTKTHVLSPGWNLVSVPIDPLVTSALVQLGDDIPLLDVFQLFGGQYYAGSEADIQAGIGYWVYVNANTEIDISGVLMDASGPLEVPLETGWNIIGNPYSDSIAWGENIKVQMGAETIALVDAIDRGIVAGKLYQYGVSAYEELPDDAELEPWRGYLLKASETCTLIISK